jgi:hypothetical protein
MAEASLLPRRAGLVSAGKVNADFAPIAGVPVLRSLINAIRVLDRLKVKVDWRGPTAEERARHEADPRLARFADLVVAIASVSDESWLVMERIWNGWPDPSKWLFLSLSDTGSIIAGYDFDTWPSHWSPPADLPLD